jgi:hypothetical protein
MRTAHEILAELRISPAGRKAAYVTTCPECSHARRKKRQKCLSVLIDGRGVRWNCHYCQWSGGEFYDRPNGTESRPVIVKTYNAVDDDRARIKRAREIFKQSTDPARALAEKISDRSWIKP